MGLLIAFAIRWQSSFCAAAPRAGEVGHDAAMPAWKPSWNTYVSRVGGASCSFVLDLAAAEHAPLASHPTRLQVRVKLLRPTADGMRDPSEQEAMEQVEDALTKRLDVALEASYVGRFVGEGHATFVFYLPESVTNIDRAVDALDLPRTVAKAGPYRPEWFAEPDPKWSFYFDFLYPDPDSYRRMMNGAQHATD